MEARVKEKYPRSRTTELLAHMRLLLEMLDGSAKDIVERYRSSLLTKNWGAGYHYLCFTREASSQWDQVVKTKAAL